MSVTGVKHTIKVVAALLCLLIGHGDGAETAQAVEFKARGAWQMTFYGTDNTFNKNSTEDKFQVYQRFRVRLDAIASESLSGVLVFKINQQWGTDLGPNKRKDIGGALGADGQGVLLRQAYMQWSPPDSRLKLRMGLQSLALPAFFEGGSPIYDGIGTGITASYKVNDTLGLTGFWIRAENDNSLAEFGDPAGYRDNWDIFGLTLPVTGEGFRMTPWAAWSYIGKNTKHLGNINGMYGPNLQGFYFRPEVTAHTPAFYQQNAPRDEEFIMGGVATEVTYFDPWKFTLDFHYGQVAGKYKEELDRAGWTLAGSAEYAMGWGTPGVMAWYSTGDDDNLKNGSERMPAANPDWRVSSFGFSGGYIINGGPGATIFNFYPAGMWAVGAYIRDLSFVNGIKHRLRFFYGQGTNSPEMAKYMVGTRPGGVSLFGRKAPAGDGSVYLTTRDHYFEVNLDSRWKLYENFNIDLELGYIRLNADKDLWKLKDWKSDAVRAGINFIYTF